MARRARYYGTRAKSVFGGCVILEAITYECYVCGVFVMSMALRSDGGLVDDARRNALSTGVRPYDGGTALGGDILR